MGIFPVDAATSVEACISSVLIPLEPSRGALLPSNPVKKEFRGERALKSLRFGLSFRGAIQAIWVEEFSLESSEGGSGVSRKAAEGSAQSRFDGSPSRYSFRREINSSNRDLNSRPSHRPREWKLVIE